MQSRFSHVRLCATPWTVACQAPLSMGFSRQEYWSKLPCPLPGDLPNPRIEPASLSSPALAGGFFTSSTIWETLMIWQTIFFTHNTNEKVMWQLKGSLHKRQPHSAYALFFAFFFFFYLARKADRMYEALDAILSHEEEGHILRMAI